MNNPLLMQNKKSIIPCSVPNRDLVDGIVIDLTAEMKKMTEEYPEASYDILGSSRVEILDLVNEVEEKVVESREKPLERKEIYEEQFYDRWYASLPEYRKQITRTILPEIADRHNLLEEQQRKSRNHNRLMVSIGIIGLLIGIVGIVLTVAALTWVHVPNPTLKPFSLPSYQFNGYGCEPRWFLSNGNSA